MTPRAAGCRCSCWPGWRGTCCSNAALGLIPVIGDAADVAHRANRKNYRLLQGALASGRTSQRSTPVYLLLAVLLIVLPLVVAIGVAVLVLVGLWALLTR